MKHEKNQTFGPVPSRRLAMSLGINNTESKFCSFNCIYCQVSSYSSFSTARNNFYQPKLLLSQVEKRIEQAEKKGVSIDYLAIVPQGEPTLDIQLGKLLKLLKTTGYKSAVISNSSLLWRSDVRVELLYADLVSLKIDSVVNATWKKINRPAKKLDLESVLRGITDFASQYQNKLITETMVLKEINDNETELKKCASFIKTINPDTSYLSFPTRPPASGGNLTPHKDNMDLAYKIFSSHNLNTEYLTAYEGNLFSSTDSLERDLLAITAVHPMRHEALLYFLKKAGATYNNVYPLLEKGLIEKISYDGNVFYRKTD